MVMLNNVYLSNFPLKDNMRKRRPSFILLLGCLFFCARIDFMNDNLSTLKIIATYLMFIYASYLITSGFCGLLELISK
jgi:hypothetical protein